MIEEQEIFRVNGVYCHLIVGDQIEEISRNDELVIVKQSDEQEIDVVIIKISQTNIILSTQVPSLKSGERKYVIQSSQSFYGIALSEETSIENINEFEAIIAQYTQYLIEKADQALQENIQQTSGAIVPSSASSTEQVEVPRSAKVIANGIEKTSEYIAIGLVKSAEFMGNGLKKGSVKLSGRIKPSEKPAELSARTLNAIEKSKQIATAANRVSTVAVASVTQASQTIAKEIVKGFNDTNTGRKVSSSKLAVGGLEIGKSAIIAVGNVYEGAVNAGVILLEDSSIATSTLVRHKYGEQAGEAANEMTDVVRNIGVTIQNANKLQPKQILKEGAKDIVREKISPSSSSTSNSALAITSAQSNSSTLAITGPSSSSPSSSSVTGSSSSVVQTNQHSEYVYGNEQSFSIN